MTGVRELKLTIRTPEGIDFSLPLAGPVSRCLAWSLDLLVILALTTAVGRATGGIEAISRDLAAALNVVAYFLISIGYGIATEWYWRGQTLGKRLLGIRVVDAQGLRLQPSQIILRNLLRFVDLLPVCYLVGGTAMLCNRFSQRLGDVAGNTVVTRICAAGTPDLDQVSGGKYNSLLAISHLAARLRQSVSPEAANIALQAILRRDQFEPASRNRLFSELRDHFAALVTFPNEVTEQITDEQYVRNVVQILFSAPVRTLSTESTIFTVL